MGKLKCCVYIFLCPRIEWSGHIVFVLCVCLFVFKYCTLYVCGTEVRTDKWTGEQKRQTSDRITRCPVGTAGGIKMCRDYKFSPKWWYLTDLLSMTQMCVMTLNQDHTVQGCPTLFPLEHDWKVLEHQCLKPKVSLRREAPKGGGWGRGSPPPAGGGRGVSPVKFLENCLKMVHSGAFWSSKCKFQNRKFMWKKLRQST